MTESDCKELLEALCAPDRFGPTYSTPFVAEVHGADWVCATDKKRFLALAADAGGPVAMDAANIKHRYERRQDPKIVSLLTAMLSPATHQIDPGTLVDALGPGGLVGAHPEPEREECTACDGYGEVECNLGHDHLCEQCDGTGWRDGRGRAASDTTCDPLRIQGLDVLLDARLARGVLDRLPASPGGPILLAKLPLGVSGSAVVFRALDWMFTVAGLTNNKLPWERAVIAEPIPAAVSPSQ